jgi:hypothetical protein
LSTVPTITPVTSDPTAKILKMDITNAVQHIKSVNLLIRIEELDLQY